MANKHSFISYIRNKYPFSLVVDGFSLFISWILNIRQRIKITITKLSIRSNFLLIIRLRKIIVTITNSLVKLIDNITLIINLKKINIIVIMHQIIKFIINLNLKGIFIDASLHLKYALGIPIIKVSKISITDINMIAAEFAMLSDYDLGSLATIDSGSLTGLDYIVAP